MPRWSIVAGRGYAVRMCMVLSVPAGASSLSCAEAKSPRLQQTDDAHNQSVVSASLGAQSLISSARFTDSAASEPTAPDSRYRLT